MKNVLQKAANERKCSICGMEMPLNPPFLIHKTPRFCWKPKAQGS